VRSNRQGAELSELIRGVKWSRAMAIQSGRLTGSALVWFVVEFPE
jgi:hypothetical protein